MRNFAKFRIAKFRIHPSLQPQFLRACSSDTRLSNSTKGISESTQVHSQFLKHCILENKKWLNIVPTFICKCCSKTVGDCTMLKYVYTWNLHLFMLFIFNLQSMYTQTYASITIVIWPFFVMSSVYSNVAYLSPGVCSWFRHNVVHCCLMLTAFWYPQPDSQPRLHCFLPWELHCLAFTISAPGWLV